MITRLRDLLAGNKAADARSLIHWLGSLNRMLFIAVAAAGFAALFLSVSRSWFDVPVAPPAGAESPGDVVHLSPHCTIWFQAFLAIGGICMAASWLWRHQWTMLSTALASVLCILPLTYPYFVMLRSPVVSAEAAWLQMQHDNLLWLGGDVYNNAEYAQRGWKSKVYMVDTPRQLSVIRLPSWSPWEIGLDRCQDLLLWLGYSNAYCQFVGSGWFLAVIGSALLLLTSLQQRGQFVYRRCGFALIVLTAMTVGAAVVGWSLPFRASRHIRFASQLCSEGKYRQSWSALNQAVNALPVLGQDTYYVAQRGVLESHLGIDSEYARLLTANRLESDSRYDQAFAILRPLTDSADPAIRREALRGVMRFAIQDYNSSRFELSEQRFRLVLRHQPCNVKLIYLIQVLGIRQSRPEVVDSMRDWMYAASNHFRFGTKKVLRACVRQHAVLAAAMRNDPHAIWTAQLEAKRP